ncbi:hypothetical protein J19TS2_44170 [Cohnella xylanilytica]|uniref:Extracellular solute-binding protein n=1 Tax=Cohnella xylanilytica TaxID=557555 RepID=A0A841U8D8_9BACL|nr:extracellular solute-binding protein [Cohnella xylanilytica]MBB6694220.1 extracellular solute-binding protein [Cohnella xylanilytica]GIO14862.1 hypothetical protein J19TS2_44170 [Cohnella xylanilytica]
MRRRSGHAIVASLLLFNFVATGCQEEKPFGEKSRAELSVMYGDERSFEADYGRAFRAKYPNVEFRVVPISSEPDDWPDIVLSGLSDYERRAADGTIASLEPLIRRDRYDLANVAPSVLRLLRGYGAGELYGLAPVFSARALYYNEDLFKEKGVAPPADRMTWPEVLRLAERFPVQGDDDDDIYGLTLPSSSSLGSLLTDIGQSEGLTLIDPVGQALLFDSPKWGETADLMLRAFKSGTVRISGEPVGRTPDEMLRSHLFAAGRSAMAVQDESLLALLSSGVISVPFTYSIVAAPVSSQDRNVAFGQSLNVIFSIHSASRAKDAAWEFIKFAAGDERARRESRSGSALVARTPYQYEREERYEAFYALDANPDLRPLSELNPEAQAALMRLLDEGLNSVLEERQTWEEAVAQMKEKAEPVLKEAFREKTN